MSMRRSQRSAAVRAKESIVVDADPPRATRPRRIVSDPKSRATVSRASPSSASKNPPSMRLTVKTSSSKLREATRSSPIAPSGSSRDPFAGGQIIEGKRARNIRKTYVVESESEEEEEEEEEEEDDDVEMEDVVDDDDAEGETVEEDEEEDEDDADGDIDMDVPPPPPVIKVSKAQSGKPKIAVKPVGKGKAMSVEQKQVAAASDDEELSELDSDGGDEVEEEEGMQTGNEEDAEGEEEEIEVEEEEDEDDLDSDGETPAIGSRASTPDLNKLTKRQRARLEEGGSGHLLALPDGMPIKISKEQY
ncbi:hypothetical protein B7494_g6006 [Chlorociboria aeruginascens]|nr:hypothetical protein B7494_g6006 [Chlorociboria aeruginascens]